MIDPDSLTELDLEQLRFVAIKVTEQGQRWVSAMHTLRDVKRGGLDNPHLLLGYNLATNEVANAREDYLVAIAGFLGFFIEEEDEVEPYFVCEYCLGTGCKTCGYTGKQLDPESGEPISTHHANVVAKTFNDNLLEHRIDNDQLTTNACVCGFRTDSYAFLIKHVNEHVNP